MEGVMYPLPTLSRPPSEEGGRGDASRATLLTRLSISSALSSVFSFSSCINLRGIGKKNIQISNLDNLLHNWDGIGIVDQITDEMCRIMTDSARVTFSRKVRRRNKIVYMKRTTWFNFNCWHKSKEDS